MPLINKQTRITAHSATLIDNKLTNNLGCKQFNGIVISDISDHLPVFVYEVDEAEIAEIGIFQKEIKVTFGSLFLVLIGIHVSMKAILM